MNCKRCHKEMVLKPIFTSVEWACNCDDTVATVATVCGGSNGKDTEDEWLSLDHLLLTRHMYKYPTIVWLKDANGATGVAFIGSSSYFDNAPLGRKFKFSQDKQ